MRAPARPAASPFSGFSTTPRKASWDELSRERESDGATKNYSVPPELIELARANRKGRGQVGTLTPLAPKPAEDVPVVVPATAPVAIELAPESSPQPDSEPTALYRAGQIEALGGEAPASPFPAPMPAPEMSQIELAAEDSEAEQREPEPEPRVEITSVRPKARRSSRRSRRSSRIDMPLEAALAARAATRAQSPRSHWSYATGAALVAGYLVLCYYVNALLAGLP